MREPIRDRSRLEHIQTAINYILSFTKDKTLDELSSDKILFFAVVKNIEIIGEAANMLSSAFKEAHQEVAWRDIAGMRNFLVHEYFRVDSDTVWAVIHSEIVELKEQVSRFLSDTDWEKWEQNNVEP